MHTAQKRAMNLTIAAFLAMVVVFVVYMVAQSYSVSASEVLPANAVNVQRGDLDLKGVADPLFSAYAQKHITIQPVSGTYAYGEVEGTQGRVAIARYTYQFASSEQATTARQQFLDQATTVNNTQIQVAPATQQEAGKEVPVTTLIAVGSEGDEVRLRMVQREGQIQLLLINGFSKDDVERLLAEQGQ